MSKRKKKIEFIRQNRHLPPGELAAQTGFDERQVAVILDRLKAEKESSASPSDPVCTDKRLLWTCLFFLVLAVVLFYLPVLKNGFVGWDDEDIIVNNPHLHSLGLSSLWWMLTTNFQGYWFPLTWLSFALNFWMGGLDPRVYHLTNLLFHVLNTILVFLVCLRILGIAVNQAENIGENRMKTLAVPAAMMTALLFSLHPIHVESVAWATERKDVLYAFFFLSGIYFYLDYAADSARKVFKLYACAGMYLLALMSKPMAATLPLVLVILDGWPLRRFPSGIKKILTEKIPVFSVAILAGLVNFLLLSGARPGSESVKEILLSYFYVMNAFRSLVFYLWKMIAPLDLVPLYPFPQKMDYMYKLENLLAAFLVVLVTYACFRSRKKAPFWLAAWAYYLATLAPVLGLIQIGDHAAADRYTYLPNLSLFLLFSTGVAYWLSDRRTLLWGFTVALTAVLGFGTVKQIGIWRDSQTLWESVVKVYPDVSSTAHTNLGIIYTKIGRLDDALREFNRAMVIPPPSAITYNGLGNALLFKGRVEEAIQAFITSISLNPHDILPRQNLWKIYERLGKHEEAIAQMQAAIEMDPNNANLYTNLGVSYCFLKKYKEAEAAFRKSYFLEPSKPMNVENLATVCLWQGRPDEALDYYRKAIGQNPKEPVYYLRMGDIYLDKKMSGQALEMLKAAISLNPADPKIVQQIGEDYEKVGEKALARQCYERARALAGTTGSR